MVLMQTETEVSDPQLTACPKADEQQSTKILFYLSVMPLETDRSLWIRRIMGWLAPDTWCEQQESVPFIWNYDLSCVLVTAIFLKINTGFCLNKKKKKNWSKKKNNKKQNSCVLKTHTHTKTTSFTLISTHWIWQCATIYHCLIHVSTYLLIKRKKNIRKEKKHNYRSLVCTFLDKKMKIFVAISWVESIYWKKKKYHKNITWQHSKLKTDAIHSTKHNCWQQHTCHFFLSHIVRVDFKNFKQILVLLGQKTFKILQNFKQILVLLCQKTSKNIFSHQWCWSFLSLITYVKDSFILSMTSRLITTDVKTTSYHWCPDTFFLSLMSIYLMSLISRFLLTVWDLLKRASAFTTAS